MANYGEDAGQRKSSPVLHHTESVKSNSDHIGVELRDRESPAQAEFGRLSRAISELDSTIVELREKIQSALGPDYPREDSSEKEPTTVRSSDLIEALRENTARIRSLRDVVASFNDRLEL